MTRTVSQRGLPRARLRTAVAIACIAAALAACGGGHGGDDADTFLRRVAPALDSRTVAAPAIRSLPGQVALDGPLAGAEVVLRAPGGDALAHATSNDAGGFVLKLPARLPRGAVVSVELPAAAHPFAGALLLVQEDLAQAGGSIRINLMTTLAARVFDTGLQRGPGYTPAQAAAEVRRYLGLPADWDLRDRDLRMFDEAAFLRAQGDASLDAALARLAARIVADPSLNEPFRGVLLGDSPDDAAAIDAAISLSRYGLEYLARFDHPVTERISGWGLAAVNWLKPDYGARFDQIDRKLEEMSTDITAIQRQVWALQTRMGEEFGRVQGALAALDDRIVAASLTNAYVTLNNNIGLAQAQILGLQRTYADHLAVGYDEDTPHLLDKLADEIIATVPAAIEQLRVAQVGTGASMTSAAAVWHRLQAIGTPQYPLAVDSAFFDAINQQQDHVAGLQVLALNLLMDAYNYKANRNRTPDALDNLPANVAPRARQAFTTYAPLIEQTQAAVAYPRIDPGLIANLQSGRLLMRHGAAMRLDRGCAQLHVAWREGGSGTAREFRAPAPDCDFRFANATPAFNAMRPFGFADWAVAEMPVFRWERGTTNLVLAQSLGYDFSAIYRHGADARASSVINVEGGLATLRWGFLNIGAFGYYSPPLATLAQLGSSNGGFHNVFFSRPIAPDPVAKGCTMTDGWTLRCKFG